MNKKKFYKLRLQSQMFFVRIYNKQDCLVTHCSWIAFDVSTTIYILHSLAYNSAQSITPLKIIIAVLLLRYKNIAAIFE